MSARIAVESILNLLFPPLCTACGDGMAGRREPLCPGCARGLNLLRAAPACPRCGVTPGPYLTPEGRCSACRLAHFAFEGTCRAAAYEGVALALLRRFKFQRAEHLDLYLTELMVRSLRQCPWSAELDVITAVPAHWYRRWTVRFHPAEALGRGVARWLRLPYARLVRRVRLDPHQIGMSLARRKANVLGAFRPTMQLDRLNVCVVDDVMTSGSTLDEVARTLKACGARRVWNLVWARAQPPS